MCARRVVPEVATPPPVNGSTPSRPQPGRGSSTPIRHATLVTVSSPAASRLIWLPGR
jgi:hypothetical protein